MIPPAASEAQATPPQAEYSCAVEAGAGIDVSVPVAGFYRCRLARQTVIGGVRIWFGPPHDPVTGEEMDRSWRWQAQFDGEPIDFDRVWPLCAGTPISEQDYRALVARRQWASQHAPESAYAGVGRRFDLLSDHHPLPF